MERWLGVRQWLVFILLLGCVSDGSAAPPVIAPLSIGESITMWSQALGEERRINVYFPYDYSPASKTALPVIYMPDGGLQEDFVHVAGVLQVSIGNQTSRPFLLVGIENTQRRRDLTGPTEIAAAREIAPEVGGSAAYRRFLKKELIPLISDRYPVTDERAIIGESLAGLFVVETYLLEPGLFQHYFAIDPSLWWNGANYVDRIDQFIDSVDHAHPDIFLATSSQPEIRALTRRFAARARQFQPSLNLVHVELPQESHATIYHPAALIGLRRMLAPAID